MLYHKYLISAFSTGGHLLRRLLEVLLRLNSTNMVWKFGMVDDYDLEPLEALLHLTNVYDVVERELHSVEKSFYQMVVPRLVASATSVFDSLSIFFTDGSKGAASIGFGVYYSDGLESSFRLRDPSGVFTSAMSAIGDWQDLWL
jgi:hypothetical protein